MSKKDRTHLLSEDWDTDPSASDNESYEIEMAQDDTMLIPGNKENTSE